MPRTQRETRPPNPLTTLPSILAMGDLRAGLGSRLQASPMTRELLVDLLALDPLSVWRAIRAVQCPLYVRSGERWTLPRLVAALGTESTERLLRTDPCGTVGTETLRSLWLGGLATACAARTLAASSGSEDPDEAYLLGLLRALPDWLGALHRLRTGRTGGSIDPLEWTRHWNLPPELAAAAGIGPARSCDAPILDLLSEAGRLAASAGFGPEPDGPPPSDAAAGEAISRVRGMVEERLRHVGLDPDRIAATPTRVRGTLTPGDGSTSIDELALSLLSCSDSERSERILEALQTSAVEGQGYDRACILRWRHPGPDLVLRSLSTLVQLPVEHRAIRANAAEHEAMRLAMEEGRPVRITATHRTDGILEAISADEALLVLLNRDFRTPSFLVLDRSLSLRPIRSGSDVTKAQVTCLAGNLLIENLLLRKRRQRADRSARIDGLTRLLNRAAGIRILDREISRARRNGQDLSILLCDLDRFKQLNDKLGHLTGDEALRASADVLRRTVRRTDAVCRFGGEEFLVILPDTDASNAAVLAARLHTEIEKRGKETALPLTISIGLSILQPGDSRTAILRRADRALYASKDRGRNRFAVDAPLTPARAGSSAQDDRHGGKRGTPRDDVL